MLGRTLRARLGTAVLGLLLAGTIATTVPASPVAAATVGSIRTSTGDGGRGGVSCPAIGSCSLFGNWIADELHNSAWAVGSTPQLNGLPLDYNGSSCPVPGWCAVTLGQTASTQGNSALVGFLKGDSWSLVQLPPAQLSPPVAPGGGMWLGNISCTSTSWCVAVGSYQAEPGPSLGQDALIATYSGGTWTVLTAPLDNVADGGGAISIEAPSQVSCAAAGACTAVGSWSDALGNHGLIETLARGRWTAQSTPAVSPPLPSGEDASPEQVVCSTPGACIAVGWFMRDPVYGPASVLYWSTGGVWAATVQPLSGLTPPAGPIYEPLHSVTIEAITCRAVASCVAVGEYDDAAGNQYGLIEMLDHGSWHARTAAPSSAMLAGATNPNVFLHDVTCATVWSCVAVGNYWGGNFIERFSFGVWTPTTAPLAKVAPAGSSGSYFGGVSCASPTWCVAAGEAWNGPTGQMLVAIFNGSTWTPRILPWPPSS